MSLTRNSQISRLSPRRSPKKYMGTTEADLAYYEGLAAGLDEKTAAKQAQDKTGLSLLTGQRIKTRGFGVTYGKT